MGSLHQYPVPFALHDFKLLNENLLCHIATFIRHADAVPFSAYLLDANV